MITFRQHFLTSVSSTAKEAILPGDGRRVCIVLASYQSNSLLFSLSEANEENTLFFVTPNATHCVLLFRDYGTLIQQQVWCHGASPAIPYVCTEILDSNFRNI